MTRADGEAPSAKRSGMRIEAKDLRAKERVKLEDAIPLAAPFVVYIEPTNLCNFRCSFCPTGDKPLLKTVGRQNATMSFDLFRKIVDDIKAFETELKLVSLYKDGEPLLHKRFADMAAYVKSAGVCGRVWTKTNGSLLNPELNRRLVDSGIDMICISVEHVSAEGFKRIAGVDIDYERYLANVRDLFEHRGDCEIYAKIADSGLAPEEIARFYADFQPISTYVGVEKLMGWSYSDIKDFTLGIESDTYDGLPFTPKEVCAYPFYVMAVNATGSVSMCGNDWSHNTVVGDAAKESMREIWNGARIFEFRKMMLECRRKENKACGNCYYLKIVPDNIDAHREVILRRIEENRRDRAAPDGSGARGGR
jgi:radical SAM protein with 4Fe4S-binding SPASM domain